MIRFFILAIWLVTGCSSQSIEKPNEKKADLYYGQGTTDLYAKNYTQALKNLLKADELTPNNSKIQNNLGMAYYFKEQEKLALFHLTRAAEIDPTNTDAKMNIATIYFNSGK